MTEPLRVLLDSDAFNALADDAVLARVEAATRAGHLELVTISVQEDEVAKAPDARRRRLQRLSRRATYAVALPLDVGRLDMAMLPTAEEEAIYNAVRTDGLRHAGDATLLLTARALGVTLVCVDQRLTSQCRKHGVAVMHPAELVALLPT